MAALHLLAVSWALLPPEEGPLANALPLLAAATTRLGAGVPGAPELPHAVDGALALVALLALQPLAAALRSSVRGPAALADALLGAVGAGDRAQAPAGPLVPHPVHWGRRGAEGQLEHQQEGKTSLSHDGLQPAYVGENNQVLSASQNSKI